MGRYERCVGCGQDWHVSANCDLRKWAGHYICPVCEARAAKKGGWHGAGNP